MLLEGLKDACEESGLLAEVLAEERADEKARKICLNAVLSAQVSSQRIIPDDNEHNRIERITPNRSSHAVYSIYA